MNQRLICWRKIGVFLFLVFLGGGAHGAPLTVEAEHDLGVQYLKGEGVAEDKVKGRQLIQQSALRGYPLAQFHVGLLFYRGEGGDRYLPCAKWWLAAAARSESDAGQLAAQALAELEQQFTLPNDNRFLLANVFDETQCTRLHNRQDIPPSITLAQNSAVPTQDVSNTAANLTPHEPLKNRELLALEATWKAFHLHWGRAVELGYARLHTAYMQSLLSRGAEVHYRRKHSGTPMLVDTPLFIANQAQSASALNAISSPASQSRPQAREIKKVPTSRQPHRSANLGGALRQASGQHYTLQVSSASRPEGLYDTARHHQLSNYWVYQTVRHGRAWYILVYGEYANKALATQAIAQLPANLKRNQPWVRRLKHVQAESANIQ